MARFFEIRLLKVTGMQSKKKKNKKPKSLVRVELNVTLHTRCSCANLWRVVIILSLNHIVEDHGDNKFICELKKKGVKPNLISSLVHISDYYLPSLSFL